MKAVFLSVCLFFSVPFVSTATTSLTATCNGVTTTASLGSGSESAICYSPGGSYATASESAPSGFATIQTVVNTYGASPGDTLTASVSGTATVAFSWLFVDPSINQPPTGEFAPCVTTTGSSTLRFGSTDLTAPTGAGVCSPNAALTPFTFGVPVSVPFSLNSSGNSGSSQTSFNYAQIAGFNVYDSSGNFIGFSQGPNAGAVLQLSFTLDAPTTAPEPSAWFPCAAAALGSLMLRRRA